MSDSEDEVNKKLRKFLVQKSLDQMKTITVNSKPLSEKSPILNKLFAYKHVDPIYILGIYPYCFQQFLNDTLESNDYTKVKGVHLDILTTLAAEYDMEDLLVDLIMQPKNFKHLSKAVLLEQAQTKELFVLMNRIEQQLVNSPQKVYHTEYLNYLEFAKQYNLKNLKDGVEAHLVGQIEKGVFKGWNTLEKYMIWSRDNGVLLARYENALENFLAVEFETKRGTITNIELLKSILHPYLNAAQEYNFEQLWTVVEKYLIDTVKMNITNRSAIGAIIMLTDEYDIQSIKDTVSHAFIQLFINQPNLEHLNTAVDLNLILFKNFISDYLGNETNFKNLEAEMDILEPRARAFVLMHKPK